MAMVRTFVAIEMTPLHDTLAQIQDLLRNGPGGRAGRWVRPEGIHLTLKFLGDVPEQKLDGIFAAVDHACQPYAPLRLHLVEAGCFPNARDPRVIWVGAEDETGQLIALQRAVEGELAKLGFEREGRAFRPHLTLARIQRHATRAEAAQLGEAAAKCVVPSEPWMRVDHVGVIKSDLRPEGPIYTRLHEASLSGPGGA